MKIVFNNWKIAGYALIAFTAVFVFYVSRTICFSTNIWLLEPDPTFAYLLNGLNIATIHSAGHTDHPGTFLQVIIAVMLHIFYFFAPDANTNDLVLSVLNHPEWYLKNIYTSFFVLQSVILAIVAIKVWSSFNNFALLVVVLTGLFASHIVLSNQACTLRPEILIPSLILLLALVTLKRLQENNLNPSSSIPSHSLVFGAGALAGAALFTKVTCFPLFIVCFLFWKDLKSRLYYIAGFTGTALICMPFILPRLKSTILWFVRLALYDGHYGTGSRTILNPTLFYANIITIISTNVPTIIFIVLILIGLFVHRKTRHTLAWEIFILYMISIIIIIALSAMHFSQHYLLAMYMPAFFMPFMYITHIKRNYIKIATCVLCLFFALYNINTLYDINRQRNSAVFINTKNFYYDEYTFQNFVIVESYRSYSKPYALAFGNAWSNGIYGELLRSMYPYHFDYNVWNNQFYHFQKSVDYEEIASLRRPILIRGTNLRDDYIKNLILGNEITSFPEGDVMYELFGVKRQ